VKPIGASLLLLVGLEYSFFMLMEHRVGLVEKCKDGFRARLQFRLKRFGQRSVRGPWRGKAEAARHDLAQLLRAKASASAGASRYEATRAAAASLAKLAMDERSLQESAQEGNHAANQRAEVEELARCAAEAMKDGDHGQALASTTELLRHPVGLDERWVGGGRTLLAEAVRFNSAAVVAVLLDHGADVNMACVSGLAPLHIAAMNGRPALAHDLLLWGANPNQVDSGGLTPLRKAILLAPAAALMDTRELLLYSGTQESAADRQELARRVSADSSDRAFLARFHVTGHAPPESGVASQCA
jgi:hypothetical protein